jgi:hypothetical protein
MIPELVDLHADCLFRSGISSAFVFRYNDVTLWPRHIIPRAPSGGMHVILHDHDYLAS